MSCSPFSKRQKGGMKHLLTHATTLFLRWHRRPDAEQRTETCPVAPARVLGWMLWGIAYLFPGETQVFWGWQ